MDTTTPTQTPTNIVTTTTTLTKSPEHETETPPKFATTPPATTTPKISSFSNGLLKRLHHNNNHHHHPTVTYKECLKNHAATLGGHALDGCGEFMTSPTATITDPTSLKCAACGCHRNFHRREPEEPPLSTTTHVIEYQPHHRHQPLPPPQPYTNRSPNSSSPPPISSSYYPSAPHMLLALSTALPENISPPNLNIGSLSHSRKRFRTKFSQEQKEKMLKFAEKVGWKMVKKDDDFVHEFCSEIGVDRNVLKVWMHNNKNTFAKREINVNNDETNIGGVKSNFGGGKEDDEEQKMKKGTNDVMNVEIHRFQNDVGLGIGVNVRANGSSSS